MWASLRVNRLSERSLGWNGNARLRRPHQPPFNNTPCANPIQFLAQRADLLKAVVEFAELRRC